MGQWSASLFFALSPATPRRATDLPLLPPPLPLLPVPSSFQRDPLDTSNFDPYPEDAYIPPYTGRQDVFEGF